jgi:hypothetical protein
VREKLKNMLIAHKIIAGLGLLVLWGLLKSFSAELFLMTAGVLPPFSAMFFGDAAMTIAYGPKWQTRKNLRNFGIVFGCLIGFAALYIGWRAAVDFGGASPGKTWLFRILAPAVIGWLYGRLITSFLSSNGEKQPR